MKAVWFRARAEIRARWRAWAGIAVLLGLFASVVMATGAGARRTRSALPRFTIASDAADAFVGNVLNERLQDAIEHLPQVRAFGRVAFMLIAPKDASGKVGSAFGITTIASVDGKWMRSFDRARVLRGRMPDPADPDEVLVNEAFADTRNVDVGDVVTFVGYAPDQLQAIFNGQPVRPSGPTLKLEVVGIGRVARDLAIGSDVSMDLTMVATPAAFARRSRTVANFGVNDMVQLERGAADLPGFRRDAERLFAQMRTPDDELAIDSSHDVLSPTRDALGVQATALWLFAGVAALALVLVLGQAISRRVVFAAEDAWTLSSIGMTRGARFVSAMVPVVLSVTTAAVLSGALAFSMSGVFPTGLARLAEPEPGLRADPLVLSLGPAAVMLIVLARVAPGAWLAVRHRADQNPLVRPSRVAAILSGAGGSASSVVGVRMALEPGRGKASVPVRAAIVSAMVGLGVVAAALTMGSSLRHVIGTPRLYGWNWDVAIAGPEDPSLVPELTDRVSQDPAIGDYATVTLADIRVNGRRTQGLEFASVRGDVFASIGGGRRPQSDSELVLGSETMRALKVGIGDEVMVGDENRTVRPIAMRVVGRATFAGIDDDALDDGVGLAAGALRRLFSTLSDISGADDASDFIDVVARLKPGTDVDAAHARLRETFGETNAFLPSRPAEVENLRRVSSVPLALGALVILMSVATVAHVLVTTARRRARDISILKTLGFVKRQVHGVIAWEASTFALVALVVGLPLGLAAGRWGWRLIADRLGVPVETISPMWAIALAIPIALAVVNVVSLAPARVAARTRPAVMLRTE